MSFATGASATILRRSSIAFAICVFGCSDGNAHFTVRESVGQLQVTHATPGEMLAVFDDSGAVVQQGAADQLGSLMFRQLAPKHGYRIRSLGKPQEYTRRLTVMTVDESRRSQAFYDSQRLVAGFNYISTRDGTTLSAYVNLPGPPEKGPYPTVVSYSGYAPSKPGAPIGNYTYLCDQLPVLCDAPNDPGALIAGLFGYATVAVNMRGTGCSGGAYDFFEEMQLLDGYDVIETVAAQSWVLHHKVGMVGLSYPGITQLFVAAQTPPSLAAITPLSVIGSANSTMLPGGILNNGFALSWVQNVLQKAQPYGQGWEQARVDAGDHVCAENQLLHGQLVDTVAQAQSTKFYDPALHDRFNLATFVNNITVPVFLAGAWQDEQTGPFFFPLLSRFDRSPATRFTVQNGVHPDGFAPAVLSEWAAFLDLFVAHRVPQIDPLLLSISPLLTKQIFSALMHLELTRWSSYSSVDQAIADWKAQPKVRAIFESGAGIPTDLGAPKGTFELAFASWPPPATAQRFYFQKDGSMGATPPADAQASSSFDLDSGAGARGNLAPGGNVWDKLPAYDWRAPQPGNGVVWLSAPFTDDVIMAGTASFDLWLRSSVEDADLEVNITEVRPDGQEMYVQSGWLRASFHTAGPDATDLWPSTSYLQKDWAPLVPGEWTAVRVGTAGFHHAFRKGSRLRVLINTPGGSRAEWRFQLQTFDTQATYAIGHDASHPSSVALPVLQGATVPSPLPPCPSLRGQPCRAYAAYQNRPAQ